MFKTDAKSLEELSFAFDEHDISRLRGLLDLIKDRNMSTLNPDEFQRIYSGLASMERLKLDGKVYAFEIEDSYAHRQGGDSGEGVELWLRQGDSLEEFAVSQTRDWVLKVDEVVPVLKKAKIARVYTGPLLTDFFNLPKESDPEDPIVRMGLRDYLVEEFTSNGIEVIRLHSLV